MPETNPNWYVYRAMLDLSNWLRDRTNEAQAGADTLGGPASLAHASALAYHIARAEVERRCRSAIDQYNHAGKMEALKMEAPDA